MERRKQIAIEEQEILRKEKELTSTIRLPAEAESYRVETLAQGKRTQTVEVARAEAEKTKAIGGAEATAIESVGKAEAERMRMKASAYKQYGDAAMMSLVLEALPQVAAEVAAPLGKVMNHVKEGFWLYLQWCCLRNYESCHIYMLIVIVVSKSMRLGYASFGVI